MPETFVTARLLATAKLSNYSLRAFISCILQLSTDSLYLFYKKTNILGSSQKGYMKDNKLKKRGVCYEGF